MGAACLLGERQVPIMHACVAPCTACMHERDALLGNKRQDPPARYSTCLSVREGTTSKPLCTCMPASMLASHCVSEPLAPAGPLL